MTDRTTNAEEVLDHVAERLEAKFRPVQPVRVYKITQDGRCVLDLSEVRIRLDQLIDQLPKSWVAE